MFGRSAAPEAPLLDETTEGRPPAFSILPGVPVPRMTRATMPVAAAAEPAGADAVAEDAPPPVDHAALDAMEALEGFASRSFSHATGADSAAPAAPQAPLDAAPLDVAPPVDAAPADAAPPLDAPPVEAAPDATDPTAVLVPVDEKSSDRGRLRPALGFRRRKSKAAEQAPVAPVPVADLPVADLPAPDPATAVSLDHLALPVTDAFDPLLDPSFAQATVDPLLDPSFSPAEVDPLDLPAPFGVTPVDVVAGFPSAPPVQAPLVEASFGQAPLIEASSAQAHEAGPSPVFDFAAGRESGDVAGVVDTDPSAPYVEGTLLDDEGVPVDALGLPARRAAPPAAAPDLPSFPPVVTAQAFVPELLDDVASHVAAQVFAQHEERRRAQEGDGTLDAGPAAPVTDAAPAVGLVFADGTHADLAASPELAAFQQAAAALQVDDHRR